MALGYKVALTNVWWNRGGQDVRLFQNTTEQQTYFAGLGLYWNELNNFNLNDNITTTIIFKDKSGRDAETLLKCNYAIVWNTIKNTYRYYFITDIRQDSANQMQVALDLDDIQTNFVKNRTKIKNIYVKQWTGANVLKNNTTYELLPSEETIINTGDNPAKFNQITNDIFFKYTNNDNVNKWLNDNIACWKYVFAVINNQIKAPVINNTSTNGLVVNISSVFLGDKGVSLPYAVFCVPIYKKDSTKKIYLTYNYTGARYGKLTEVALDSLFTSISDNYPIGTYCIQEKYSNICPYNTDTLMSRFSIDANGDLMITNTIDATNSYVIGQGVCYYLGGSETGQQVALTKENANDMFISGIYQKDTTIECEVDNPIKMINLTEAEAKETNTKLMDSNYSTFRLRIASQIYDYNPLALLNDYTDKLSLSYTEVLQVGISKIYLRFNYDIGYSNYYTDANSKDYTGLIASLDFSEPLLTNQWADYLANNKNYFLQTQFNNTISLVQSFTKPQNLTLGGGLNAGLSLFAKTYNQQLERENMQQAPDGLSNGNGDPYFNISVDGIRPKLDYLTISNWNKKVVLDSFKLEGTPKNKVYSTLSQLLYTHINYDVLSLYLTYDSLSISTKEFNRLKDILSKTNRFWYNDNLDLEAVNYLV